MVKTGSAYAFSPASLTIKHGVALTVTNTTAAPHTVTADNGAFDSGTVNPGSTTTMMFSNPGSYPFHCAIHTYMTGTITVT
jgi:plastocyanin